jgi:hypothetical protein
MTHPGYKPVSSDRQVHQTLLRRQTGRHGRGITNAQGGWYSHCWSDPWTYHGGSDDGQTPMNITQASSQARHFRGYWCLHTEHIHSR